MKLDGLRSLQQLVKALSVKLAFGLLLSSLLLASSVDLLIFFDVVDSFVVDSQFEVGGRFGLFSDRSEGVIVGWPVSDHRASFSVAHASIGIVTVLGLRCGRDLMNLIELVVLWTIAARRHKRLRRVRHCDGGRLQRLRH